MHSHSQMVLRRPHMPIKFDQQVPRTQNRTKNTFLKNVHSIISMTEEDIKNMDPALAKQKAKYVNFLPNSVQRKMKQRKLV